MAFSFSLPCSMASIDLLTAQNVEIEYELASLQERFFAILIDLLIVFGGYYAILILLSIATEGRLFNGGGFLIAFFFYLLPIALFVLYQFGTEVWLAGQSYGKRAMSIKVVRLDGHLTRLSDHLIRAVFYLVDLTMSAGVIGALSILASPNRQRFGDHAAHTTVIRLQSKLRFDLGDIFKIESIEGYEPTFEEVKQLTESDMLLIKQTLSRYKSYPNPAHRQLIIELAARMKELLQVEVNQVGTDEDFLKLLIRDYIVLTR
ncbi:MAG: RDD family protein [Bacteroidota bacterium]